jgi:hypothetical protein
MRSSLIATVALVMDFLDRISEKIFKKSRPDRQNMVYIPDKTLLVGILIALIFTAIGIVFLIFGDVTMWFSSGAFFLFALFGVSLVIAYFNCRITFRDQDFTYKRFFGINRTIEYRDLTGILEGNSDVKLYAGDKVIYVAGDAVNGERFIALAKKRYREHNGGKTIPKTRKKDIFNNHVKDPQAFVLVFVILTVPFILMPIGLLTFAYPDSREAFTEKSITVDSYEISDGNLYMYDSFDSEYCVSSYTDVINNSSELISKLSSGTRLDLLIIQKVADRDVHYVSSIEMNGKHYLTYDRWYEHESYTFKLLIVVFAILDLLIFFFVGATIYVGRNPHKFSDRVIHIFFKLGTIRRD